MSTTIEWTRGNDGSPGETWNPVTGCTKVSPGCDHCYAERITTRFGGPGAFDKVTLHPDRLERPLRWRKPRRVFVNSMSDLFHDDVPDEFIAQVFAVMSLTPQHTYQILTKRHARMRALLSSREFVMLVDEYHGAEACDFFWPLPGVWLGVSVENQQWADIRIPALLDTPAAVRFLSCEPLLGRIDLSRYLVYHCVGEDVRRWGVDWVIVGGESGPGARPMHPDWARSLRDQCVAAGVPYFFKQWGEWQGTFALNEQPSGDTWVNAEDGRVAPEEEALADGGDWLQVSRVGKKRAGRELDGRTWDEFPAQQAVLL